MTLPHEFFRHFFLVATPLVAFTCEPSLAEETDRSTTGATGFVVLYEAPVSPAYTDLFLSFRNERTLDALAEELNRVMRLPTRVTLATTECGQANAFYVAEEQAVVVCYELLVELAREFSGLDDYEAVFSGTFSWIFLHELGHALIDVLELPITGREEDVADEFATMAALDEGDDGVEVVEAAAVWFLFNYEHSRITQQVYADTHALNAQRFFNMICWIYGSDPQLHQEIVAEGWLPAQRARGCPLEYQRARQTWTKLLAPYLAASKD